jgi:hypothetical protein
MKKNITVSVDSIAYLNAKNYTNNISSYLSECLESLCNVKANKDSEESNRVKLEEINNSIQDLIIKRSILEMEIKKNKELLDNKLKQDLEREKFKRWKCPVCQTINTLDLNSCHKCNLPTKNDKKTIFVLVNKLNEIVEVV